MKINMRYTLLYVITSALYGGSLSYFQQSNISLAQAQQNAMKGDFSLLPALVYKNILTANSINNADTQGASLLYWAVYHNNLSAVSLCLSLGAGPTILSPQYKNQTRPLDIAIQNDNLEIIQVLVGAQIIQNKIAFIESLNGNSPTSDYMLLTEINNASEDVQMFFYTLTTIFAGDFADNKDYISAFETPVHGLNYNISYYCEELNNTITKIQFETDTVTTIAGVNPHFFVVYPISENNYYVEAYDESQNYLACTDISENNPGELLTFYIPEYKLLFRCGFSNLDEIMQAANEQTAAPIIDPISETFLCKAQLPATTPAIIILGTELPCNTISLSMIDNTPIIDCFLNTIFLHNINIDPSLITFTYNNQKNQPLTTFISQAFTKATSSKISKLYGSKEITTIYNKSSIFPSTLYFGSIAPLFDYTTSDKKPITLLGSTTPFDQLQYFNIQGQESFLTFLQENAVTVDNFDPSQILITNNQMTKTLSDFIAAGNFTGTYYIKAAGPLFDIFTQNKTPLTLPQTTIQFDEIILYTLNQNFIVQFYLKGKPLDIPEFNFEELSIVDTKTNTALSLPTFIANGIFAGTYYVTTTPPIFAIKTKDGLPIQPVGCSAPFDEIKGFKQSDETIKIVYLLQSNIINTISLTTDTILITDQTNTTQNLTEFIKAKNFSGTYTVSAQPMIFNYFTKNKMPLTDTATKITFDEIQGALNGQTIVIYPYLKKNLISTTASLEPKNISLEGTDGTIVILSDIIAGNDFSKPYIIINNPIMCILKTNNALKIQILGTTDFFDEIRCIGQGSTVVPYTYINGVPVTIPNFDPNNVLVTDVKGKKQTLPQFIQARDFKTQATISAMPPLFDIKAKNNIPLQLLGSTVPFDEIKYFSLNGKLAVHTYLNGEETDPVDNFDLHNIIIIDQMGKEQPLDIFIQNNNFTGKYSMIAAAPLLDIKSKTMPIRTPNSNDTFDEIKHFTLNGKPITLPYLRGAQTKIDNFNIAKIQVTNAATGATQLLSDLIASNNYQGTYYLKEFMPS